MSVLVTLRGVEGDVDRSQRTTDALSFSLIRIGIGIGIGTVYFRIGFHFILSIVQSAEVWMRYIGRVVHWNRG